MNAIARLLGGTILCLAMAAPVSAADQPGPVTLDIQHTKPTDIVWSTVQNASDRPTISGLVRHRGPPGRNEIRGHVVAVVERSAAGDGPSETRIDVPLTPMEQPQMTAREARFSFVLPVKPDDPVIVHLQYVEARMPPPGSSDASLQ